MIVPNSRRRTVWLNSGDLYIRGIIRNHVRSLGKGTTLQYQVLYIELTLDNLRSFRKLSISRFENGIIGVRVLSESTQLILASLVKSSNLVTFCGNQTKHIDPPPDLDYLYAR